MKLSEHLKQASLETTSLDAKEAATVVDAARAKAEALKSKMCIAVVDNSGNLKAFVRMDNAWVGSVDIAIKKARTAWLFTMPTEEIGKLSRPDKPLHDIEVTNDGLVSFPGGLPLKRGDEVVGAIGVSGDTVDKDKACAVAGAKGLK